MSDVKLIYFEGCPEAANVRAALLTAGVYDFQVFIQNLLPKENEYRQFSSPSVLNGNELIYGIRTQGESTACTFDSINWVDQSKLVDRFKELKVIDQSVKRSKNAFVGSFFSGLLAVKCPACIPALGAFLSSLGLSFLISQIVLKTVLVSMLALSMLGLIYSYKQHKNIFPVLMGGVFCVLMYLGRYYYIDADINQYMVYVSIVGLILISVWDFRIKSKKRCSACV